MSDRPGGEDRAPEDEPRPPLQRLDPERAAARRTAPADTAATSAPVIDTRRYRWMIGIFGLALVLAISVYQFASHGVSETGVSAGHRLHFFAAPLAATNLEGDPNANPTCSPARHDPRALNVCLMARRGPLVLSFFVPGATQCVREVSALQTLASRYPTVQFAAVAIDSTHRATAAVARRHRWTIPVAYDRDGRVGALYGVAACPMVELAARGGIVHDRLIGDRWQTAAALAPEVQRLLTGARRSG